MKFNAIKAALFFLATLLSVAPVACGSGTALDSGAPMDFGASPDGSAANDSGGARDMPGDSAARPEAGMGDLGCGNGDTRCGAECVNLQSDPLHCGACDSLCCLGTVCSYGVCAIDCQMGLTGCPEPAEDLGCHSYGVCANLTTDPNHCGACEIVCPHGTVCQLGVCK